MVAMITDPVLEEQLIRERQERGLDRYDEVWEGVYIMSPLAGREHQQIVGRLLQPFLAFCSEEDFVYPGCNVSDRIDWVNNYRCPDVAVYLRSNPAQQYEAFMLGGPDLAIEVLSRGDRAHEKLDFYAEVKTRELLILNREPWSLELYQWQADKLVLMSTITPDQDASLATMTVPLSWRFEAGVERPRVLITSGEEFWRI